MTDDNHKNKKGFSGLSDLASEFKNIEDPISLETNKSAEFQKSKQNNQLKQERVLEPNPANSTKSKNPIGSDKNANGSSGKWIMGIIGVIILLQGGATFFL
jgi:hypothetical protein